MTNRVTLIRMQPVTDQTIHQIVNGYFESLPNKNVAHSRYLVLFSGMVASGKTTIAKLLEHELFAVRVSNDEIRKRIVAVDSQISLEAREDAKLAAATELFERLLEIPN